LSPGRQVRGQAGTDLGGAGVDFVKRLLW
jgi:hypothetical protein